MPKGIVVKIWNVSSGSGKRSSSKQISDSIDYIFNKEKCSEKLDDDLPFQLGRELKYVTNDVKTLEGLYVGGRHILDIENAANEMLQIKEYYGKLDGRAALHGTISLDALESDKQNAGKLMLLCDELMREIFVDHQAVYAVHTNTEHLHVHFVINTVGMGGKKIHMDNEFMKKVFQPAINRLAAKYGFTENEQWKKENKKDVLPIVERKMMLRKLIDLAIEETEDFGSFVKYLSMEGVTVNVGKYLSLKTDEMPKAIRSFRLGDQYTVDAIQERIMHKRDHLTWLEMNTHTTGVQKKEMASYVPSVLKKYQDMSPEEKKKAIKMLRLGKNPWRTVINQNWQVKKAANDLSIASYTHEIVRSYAPSSMNVADAKEEIKRRQKLIREDRKLIKENLKKYKPLFDLYFEMKELELPAYLFDVAGREEFATQYASYKELSERMEKAYGKSIDEVSAFYEGEQNELMYAKAQEDELSEQYRSLLRYEKHVERKSHEDDIHLSFFDAVGHSKAKQDAKFGLLSTRLVFITADEVENIVIRVKTTPDVVEGKPTVQTEVTVLDVDGTELEVISSADLTAKEFNQAVNDLKYQYQLNQCQIHKENPAGGKTKEKENREQESKQNKKISRH